MNEHAVWTTLFGVALVFSVGRQAVRAFRKTRAVLRAREDIGKRLASYAGRNRDVLQQQNPNDQVILERLAMYAGLDCQTLH